MKKQFIKFLEDNHCLNNWMDGIRNSGKDATTFTAIEKPACWIGNAFPWHLNSKYINWYDMHKKWKIYLIKASE